MADRAVSVQALDRAGRRAAVRPALALREARRRRRAVAVRRGRSWRWSVLMALLAPLIAPYDPLKLDPSNRAGGAER